MTEQTLAVIDPELLVNSQKENKGGEDHIAMMKLLIKEAQEKGSFAFVPKDRKSFDVGVIGTGRRKGAW